MRLFFVAVAVATVGLAVAAPPSKCAKDAAICTVPLVTDESEQTSDIAEPAPVVIQPPPAPPTPAPVAVMPAEPVKPLPVPTPPVAAGILDVLDWQLREYWVLSGDEPPVQRLRTRGACERATLTARFVVNNNGRTSEVRVLRNTALNPFYERRIEQRVGDRFYTPSRANPQRQSVRVEETFRFSC